MVVLLEAGTANLGCAPRTMEAPKNRTGKIACATKSRFLATLGLTALCADLGYALEFERLEWLFLRRDQQLAMKGAFSGASIERFFGRNTSEIGIIVFLRKMREDEVARAGVEAFRVAKIFADSMIREMTGAREDPLLDDPGIRADLEHIQIVVRFEHKTIGVPEMDFHELGHVAEIGNNRHFRAIRAEREADGVGGVVRDLESVNIDIADREMLARLNRFERVDAFAERVRKRAAKCVHRGLRDVERSFPQAEHLRQTVAMVGVLVGDEDSVDAVDAQFDGREPRERFAFAQAAVHKESGALGLEQGDIARAARRQYGYPQADRLLPENGRAKAQSLHKRIFRMMAEGYSRVNAKRE